VWHQSRQATEVALIASAWILGTGISLPRAPRAARVWGGLLVGSSLLMLFLPLSPAPQLFLFVSAGEEIAKLVRDWWPAMPQLSLLISI